MLEVMSLEVSVESVGTVTGVQSWRQRVQVFIGITSAKCCACEPNGEQIGIGGMSKSVVPTWTKKACWK